MISIIIIVHHLYFHCFSDVVLNDDSIGALSYLAITLMSSSGPKCAFFGRELHTVGDKS